MIHTPYQPTPKRLTRALISVGLALCFCLLTSCSAFAQVPPNKIIYEAIAQQQRDMQSAIAKSLSQSEEAVPIPDFEIGKIAVASREKILDSALRKQAMANGAYIDSLYKIVGTYDATLTKGDQTIEENNPFELYLGNKPKSMRSTVSAAEAREMWYLLAPSSAKPLP